MKGKKFKFNFNPNYNNSHYNNQLNNNNEKKKSIKFKNNKEKLKPIETIEENSQPITNIISLGESKYLVINQSEYFFRKVGKKEDKYKDKSMENSIIRKAIFSNNKVISIEEHNSNSGNSNGKRILYKSNYRGK